MPTYSVVDIFAGPGGLAEGFSKVRDSAGCPPFRIALSIEKDPIAHATLRLRSFLRQFHMLPREYYSFINEERPEPDWASLYPEQWQAACHEAWQMELGKEDPALRLNARLDAIRESSGGKVVLIGGPPCQAYSLVGRARNAGKKGYVAAEDSRHFLYEEYIRILDRLGPAAFVMENVKGILSSSVDGTVRIVEKVLDDLSGEGRQGERYRLIALASDHSPQHDPASRRPEARDFIVRAEDLGIPQARHRVIIVGIREDLASGLEAGPLLDAGTVTNSLVKVRDVLDGMPKLRSGLSRLPDGPHEWRNAIIAAIERVASVDTCLSDNHHVALQTAAFRCRALVRDQAPPPRRADGSGIGQSCPSELADWLLDPAIQRLPNNDTRGHMPDDLARYFFAALFSQVVGRSPKASEFPAELAPAHRNWKSGKFADRFRVQVWDQPSTTVTCHISKDGHYYIHPDPLQCRSLTVREAARLQTFPDNYFFKGARTDQYIQVGNAVPPMLARKIGEALYSLLSDPVADGAGRAEAEQALAHVA